MSVPINPRNSGNLPKVLIVLLLILVGITGMAFLINRYFITPNLTLKHPMIILIAGADTPQATDGIARLDSLVLALIDPENSKMALLSIPGSTRADLPETETRIGDIGGQEGIHKAGQLISDITKTRIDRFIVINFYGFQKIVDLLDGVEVEVARSIKYTDRNGLPIAEISPGRQHLDGEQALLYVRFLDSKGEADRIARQQAVLKALLAKAARPDNVINAFKINSTFKKYLQTDLTLKEIIQLATFAKSIDLRDVAVYMLPGTPDAAGWKPDYPGISRLMRQLAPRNHQ